LYLAAIVILLRQKISAEDTGKLTQYIIAQFFQKIKGKGKISNLFAVKQVVKLSL